MLNLISFNKIFKISPLFIPHYPLRSFTQDNNRTNTELMKYNLLTEKYSDNTHKEIIFSQKNIKDSQNSSINMQIINHNINKTASAWNMLKKIFLPRDYPRSVANGYLHYTKYSFFIGTLLNWMDFLSTQSLINSLGVSRNTAMNLSPGLNWVIKDGVGQLSSIFFATKFSGSFERNLKQWRILTLLIYNSALYLELICMKIHNPLTILLFASIAQSLKVCATFGNVAARIGILDHFSKENNISDLQNKSNSQANVSFVLGTLLGMGASFLIPQTQKVVMASISCSSLLYLLFAYKSIEQVILPKLNFSRGLILFRHYLKTGQLMSVVDLNKKEGAFFQHVPNMHFASYGLDLVCSKSNQRDKNGEYLTKVLQMYNREKFICYTDIKGKKSFDLYTVLSKDASDTDVLFAFMYNVKLHQDIGTEIKSKGIVTKERTLSLSKEALDYMSLLDKKMFIKQMKTLKYETKNFLEGNYLRYEQIPLKH